MSHVVISGTGRAGTTALVGQMRMMGFSCGNPSPVDPRSGGGFESDIRRAGAAYVVKSPWFCTYAGEAFRTCKVDAVLVPVRRMSEVVGSRLAVQRRVSWARTVWSVLRRGRLPSVPGGLVDTRLLGDEEMALHRMFYDLVLEATRADVPLVFMDFPRFLGDSAYLKRCLAKAGLWPPRAGCNTGGAIPSTQPGRFSG